MRAGVHQSAFTVAAAATEEISEFSTRDDEVSPKQMQYAISYMHILHIRIGASGVSARSLSFMQ